MWAHFQDLGEGNEGLTRYGAQARVVNIDQSLDAFGKLDTFLHESMHLVEGDAIGAWGSRWRTIADKFTFGPGRESQYNWRNYADLYGASYNEISATGGGSYPLEAGFNRFAVDVVNNLGACRGVCP